MIKLIFELIEEYQVKISCNDKAVIDGIVNMTTVYYSDRQYDYRTKKHIYVTVKHNICKKDRSSTHIKCPRGIAYLIYNELSIKCESGNNEFNIEDIEIDKKLQWLWSMCTSENFKYINITDRWLKDVFPNHPKGEERGIQQRDDTLTIVSSSSGIVSLPTGTGKTEIILSIVDSFLLDSRYKGNALIFTYGNKVRDEILLRGLQYGIKLPKEFDVNSRVNIINVTAFSRTNRFKSDPQVREWLSNVDLITADEAHHMSAPTWVKMMCMCNPILSYGFTATADTDVGVKIQPETFVLSKNGTHDLTYIIGYTGYYLVHRSLPVPVDVYTIKSNFQDIKEVSSDMEDNNYMQSVVDSWISLPESANLITNIYNKILVNSGICFIPVFTVQSGYELATNLFKLGIKPILWTAELSLQVIDGELSEGKLSLSDLKDIASKPDSFQILIATSIAVEGIDLKNLGSVIPLTGKSFKMLIQPVGRAARSDKVKLVLIWEKGNPILSSQMTHKFNHTKKSLNIDSLTKLNLEDFT